MDRFPVGPDQWLWALTPEEIRPTEPPPVPPIDIDIRRRWYIDAKGSVKEVEPRKGIPIDARKWTFEGAEKWFPFTSEQPSSARRSTPITLKRA